MEQPPGSKFCNQCGTAIGGSPEHRIVAAGRSVAVRKQVTALFADLAGSTAFGEQVDPEAARAALAPYFEILQSTVEDHAGTLVKFTGDGVLAVFGVPEVAEDDALRAVAAGQALQDRFRAFAEQVRQRHGVELGLRVGVNTGELVVGDDDADIVGDVLNTAARLEATCTPGRVLVGEDTWRLTRSSIAYEALGEVKVKGKAEAIATFQLVAGTLGISEDVTPFVGRSAELETLRSVFADTIAANTARLVTVIGPPGVGKTRLAAELRGTSTARTFDLRFERRGSTTFTPIADLLRELTGSGSVEDVERLVADHPEAARLAPVLASFLSHGEARSTEESFWAIRRLFEQLAADVPVIIVVDDIQWAEPLFWDLLEHLVEWTQAAVLLVALARPEIRELRPDLARPGKRVTAAIDVEGLDADTTRELAARLLGADELPPDLVDRLPDSTEGNPLFVRELVQMLVDDGVLARNGDRWHLTIDVEAIEVPPTILSLLASRVERLPDDERQVVELASVIGTEFDRGLLGSIAGADVASRLGALIDRLRRKDLVEPSGTWAGDHPVYRFHHVLVRDAAYRRLLKGHRADLHERVGRYLEDHSGSGDDGDVVVAHHYEQVHRYRSELGTVDEATQLLAERAVVRLRSAAEQALAREDLASSGSYAIRALALAGDGGERDELLVLGCEALLSAGDVARGAPLVAEFRSRELGERLAAWADCFHAQLWSLTDSARLSEATDLADDAAGRLDALDDSAGVAKARLVRASTLARLGRIGDCEAELDLALGAARAAGDRRRTVAVLGAAPLAALWGPSPVARAGGRCLDVLRLLRITTSSPAVEATSIRCQGMLEALRGRLDSARAKFETSRTTARDLGLRHGLYETELFEGFVELIAGDPVAAEPHLILARDGLGALGIGADAGQASALLGRALLRQGRLDEADALASAALESAGENLQTAVASRSVLGEIRVEQGRPDEARRLVAEALAIVERTDITIDHAIARRSAARVADHLGDTKQAASHRAAAERLLADKGVTGLMEAHSEHAVAATSEPSDTPESVEAQQAATLPGNAAWEVNEGLWSTWITGDRSGYLQLLTPDFQARIHELGPKLAFSGDRYATADVLFDSLAEDRTHAIPNRLIAKRGDDLALIAMTFQDGASSTTMYTVSQVRNGQVVRADTFAEDQLGEALDELDRRWVSLGAPADLVDGMKELRRSSADGDYARFRDLLADDFEVVAHGRLPLLDHRSADEFIESIRPLFGGGGVTTTIFADIPAITDRVALTRFHLDAADGGGWRLWYLWIWGSGRLTRADIYELDAYDAALARFEELANAGGEPDTRPVADIVPGDHDHLDAETLMNTAWVVTQLAFEAGNIDDRHGYAALHSDRFETVDHERFTLEPGAAMNRDDYVASVFDKEELGADITAFGTLIAIRHDDLCLVTTTFSIDDYLMERLVIVQTEDRQIIRTDWFDHTDLPAALDQLDRRWVALGGPAEEVRLAIAFREAQHAGDVEAARQLLHPDFVLTDHGRLGVGQLGIDDHLETAVHGAHGVVAIPIQYVAYTDSVALARIRFTTPDDSAWEHWVVTNIAGGLTRSVDMFDLDDLEAAMSCYEEPAAATPLDSVTSRPVVVTPANAATRMIEEYTAALNDGDLDRFTAAFHPEVRQELRQRLRVADANGNRGMANLGHSIIAGGGVLECEPVAIFGDQLAVCRQILRLGDDEIGECSVVEVDGGVITRVISFDDDQLVEALDTSDRRAVELGRPAALSDTEITTRGAHWRHDIEAFTEALDPSWSFHDHRRLGLGQMTREQYLTSSFPTGPGEVLYWAVELLAHTDSVWLAHDRWLAANGSGWDQLHVGVLRSGVGLSSDTFDLIDLDAARACYDQRVMEAAGVPIDQPAHPGPSTEGRPERGSSPFTNAAWEWSQACARATEASDRARVIDLMAEDFLEVARYRLNVGQELDRQEFADSLFAQQTDGNDVRIHVDLIATRGDDLALVRLENHVDGNLIEFLIVSHVVDGLAKRMVMFDETQLLDALDELDRQWAEHGGPARVLEHTVALRRAIHDGDTEAARAVLSPAIQAIDHRSLGLPTLDLDAYLAAPKGGSGTQLLVVDVARHADDASLERIQVNLEDGWSTMEMWAVISLDGHGIATIDNFDIDDADAAHARFDDLTSEVPVSHPRPFSNRAWEVGRDIVAAHDAGDRPRCASLLADTMVFVAHDPIMQFASAGSGLDREATLDMVFHEDLAGLGHVSTTELIAVRGDTLCLHQIMSTAANGDVSDRLYLTEINAAGLCTRIDSFRTDQLHEAYDELDRRYLETLPIDHEAAPRARHWYATDRDGMAAFLHPRFRFRDHRKLAWPDADRDVMLEYVDTLPPGSYATVPEVFRVTDRDFVVRRVQFMEEGTASTDSIVVGRVEDGLLVEMDWYEPDDIDAALARYDELVGASNPAGPGTLANRATRLNELLTTAGANGDRSRFTDLLSDDFASVTHEQLRISDDQLPDRDTFVQQIFDVFDLSSHVEIDSTVVAVRGDDLCLVHVVTHLYADDLDKYAVMEADGDRICATEWFDVDDLATALDVLEQRWAALGAIAEEPPFTNEAWELGEAAVEAFAAEDRDRLREIYDERFTSVSDERSDLGRPLDRDEFIDSIIGLRATSADVDTRWTLLAVRDDSLCLVRLDARWGDEISRLLIIRSEQGRIIGNHWFDPDRLFDALDELGRQWVELGGPAHAVDIGNRFARAHNRGDVAAARETIGPDFIATDGRLLGLPDLDTEDFLETAIAPARGTEFVLMQIAEHTDDLFLQRGRFTARDGSTWDQWAAVGIDRHGHSRIDAFDADDYTAAKAHYDELVSTRSATNGAANGASELMDRCCQALADGGTELHAQLLHDDFRFEVRRTSAIQYVGSRQEWIEAALFWVDDGNLSRVTNTTIATRGDRLLLGRVIVFSDVGDEWVWMHVTEIADGKVRSVVTYDDEQLDEALDELDRQWVELGGSAWDADEPRRVAGEQSDRS